MYRSALQRHQGLVSLALRFLPVDVNHLIVIHDQDCLLSNWRMILFVGLSFGRLEGLNELRKNSLHPRQSGGEIVKERPRSRNVIRVTESFQFAQGG